MIERTRLLIVVLACAIGGACAARSSPQLAPGERGHKSYLLPALEIVATDALINLGARQIYGPEHYDVNGASIRRNLRGPWVVDDDPFEINQLGHPYQGALYHGIARSNGLGYWPSVAYTFAGSVMWEIAGETTPPSRNDQIASGIAGSFLGEPLFRISRLLMERADDGPGLWRTLGSIIASPPAGLNRMMLGNPAMPPAPDAVPFSDIRVQFGAATGWSEGFDSRDARALDQPRLALSMDYGYPGTANYRHERPFDYFRIDGSVSNKGFDHLSTRGLVAGGDYGGEGFGGIWGLYGSYDYFAPEHFRFSSTAFSFGTTLQAPITRALTFQGSGLIGAGYVATHSDDRPEDFHYGAAPQALLNLRLIAGHRAAVDVTAREYYVSNVGGFDTGQTDKIFVGDAWLAVRLYSRHAVGLSYQLAGRSSTYLTLPDRNRSRSRIGLFYTFLGSGGFGAR